MLIAVAAVWTPATAQEASDLNGAWIVTAWTNADGEVNENSQRGLFIFVVTREDGGNYSMMFVPGDEPRAEYAGENQTDEETLASYASFIANSGRLIVEGNQVTFDAYMAKDPNYMADFGEDLQTADWQIEDNMLTLAFTSGFMEGLSATLSKPM